MKYYLLIIVVLGFSLNACSQKEDTTISTPMSIDYSVETVVSGLSIPWSMAFLPDEAMLITEKDGRIIHFKNGTKTEITNVPTVYNRGQGGLLDIKLHPKYEENGWLYLTYSSPDGDTNGGNTALARAKLSGSSLTDFQRLYKAQPNTTRAHHFGSRIEFDNEGYLYFTIGDRGEQDENPQDITKDGGKVYRLKDDGSIPADNPFYNELSSKKAVFSYGHRNPQGMVRHPNTGQIWLHEHGPQGGDEINIVQRGANYGWPVISYGINYDGTSFTDLTEKEGMEQPLYYWVPSIAPSGMTFVTSDVYPAWKGNLMVGALKFQYLERMVLENSKVTYREKILDGIGRVRNVVQGPDGYLYVAVEGKGIVKIVPKT